MKCEVCGINSGLQNLCKKCGWWVEEIMRWRDNLWVIGRLVNDKKKASAARRAGWFQKRYTATGV